jgi:hypothetical protein
MAAVCDATGTDRGDVGRSPGWNGRPRRGVTDDAVVGDLLRVKQQGCPVATFAGTSAELAVFSS